MAGILINSAINLVARTAYFNNYNNGIIQREMSFRDIPKSQQVDEIIEYCKTHENPNISDIVFDLQLELFAVDDIIDELEQEGIELDVQYWAVISSQYMLEKAIRLMVAAFNVRLGKLATLFLFQKAVAIRSANNIAKQ